MKEDQLENSEAPEKESVSPGAIARHEIESIWSKAVAAGTDSGMTIKAEAEEERTEKPSGISIKEKVLGHAGEKTKSPPEFEILSVLGEGGMGVVYTARQTSIDRTVALKMMKDDTVDKEDYKAKFLSEVAVTGDLDHPNIVPIYDLGANAEGALFYAMKKVEGMSWSDVIRRKSETENLDILMRVADAVAFAHSKGVIHRDIKPDNVMLGEFGEVLVMDWGLAVSVGEKGKAQSLTPGTSYGGTPAYMAPEMAKGKLGAIGFRTDVYLLGAILYEIVTGLEPHLGESPISCLMNVSGNIIQPTNKEGELVDIALKAMSTNPTDRYGTVQRFQHAIRGYLEHSESITMAVRARLSLSSAEATSNYDDFAEALFGFKQAVEVWQENNSARDSLKHAKLAYARCAFEKGDFDLASSLLDESIAEHADFLTKISAASQEREKRRRRVRTMTNVATILLILVAFMATVGFFWIRAEKERAENAELVAKQERDNAEYEAYVANIGLAESKIRERAYGAARDILARAPERLRHWEWRRLNRLCHLDLLTLEGHTKQIHACAFLPDGRQAVTSSEDGTVRLWDLESGACLRKFSGLAGLFGPMALSPDGKIVAAGSHTGKVMLWSVASGKQLRAFNAHGKLISSLDFSRDGKRLLTGSADGLVKLWETGTGKEIRSLDGHDRRWVTFVLFSPDGKQILTGSHDRTARLWNAATGELVRTLSGHNKMVVSAAFAGDGKQVLTAGHDGEIKVWNLSDGTEQRRFKTEHSIGLFRISLSPDETHVVTASPDWTARIYDVQTGKEERVLEGAAEAVYHAVYSPDGTSILTANEDGTAKLWSVGRRGDQTVLAGHNKPIRDAAVSPDGKEVLTAGEDGMVRLWDAVTGAGLASFSGHNGMITAVVFTPDGKQILTGGADGKVIIRDAATRESQIVLDGHRGGVAGFSLSADGGRLLVGAWGEYNRAKKKRERGSAKLWDPRSGELIRTLEDHAGWVATVAITPDGTRGVTAGEDAVVRLWNLSSGVLIREMKGHTHWIAVSAFSPDGRYVATGGENWDKTVRIWDVDSGSTVAILGEHRGDRKSTATGTGHRFGIISLGFSPDGKRIVTGSRDTTAKVWDTATGRELLTLSDHTGWVYVARFSPDGKHILTAGQDTRAIIW